MPASKAPLYQVVAGQILADIKSGKLQPGDRVPAVRDLEIETSNGTARSALRWLRDAGWIVTAPGGAGSFVADPLPGHGPTVAERLTDIERRLTALEQTRKNPAPE